MELEKWIALISIEHIIHDYDRDELLITAIEQVALHFYYWSISDLNIVCVREM